MDVLKSELYRNMPELPNQWLRMAAFQLCNKTSWNEWERDLAEALLMLALNGEKEG